MKWEPKAAEKIRRAPFFVRPLAKREAEKLAKDLGLSVVTEEVVEESKRRFASRSAEGAGVLAERPPFPDRDERSAEGDRRGAGASSANEVAEGSRDRSGEFAALELVIERAIEVAKSLSRVERFFEVKICGSPAGCPFALDEGFSLLEAMAGAIEGSGFIEFAGRIDGPVLEHHRFKVSIAGCPNACSEPQIKDFAVVAAARPERGSEECARCGECESACPDGSISLADDGPEIDRSRCVECARCVMACEFGALVRGESGYKVLVGGKLGRHPRLAEELPGIHDANEVISLLEKCLGVIVENGKPGERLRTVLERLGTSPTELLSSDHPSEMLCRAQ